MSGVGPDDLVNLLFGVGYSIAFLTIISLGLAVVFGMMGVTNMAHGEFLMIGAFLTVSLTRAGVPLGVSMAIAGLIVAAFGALLEHILIRRLYGRLEATMLATFGLSPILVQAAVLIWGTTSEGIPTPLGSFRVGEYSFATYSLVIMAAAVVLVVAVYLLYARSRFGVMARAVAMNPEMASAIGINSARINMGNFAVGAGLAGVGGALLAPVVAVAPSMGASYIAQAFVTVVLGGPGVVSGTAAASGLLGSVQRVVSDASTAFYGTAALLVLAIVLMRFLPTGISGRVGRQL
ncbi:hypothetical protein ACIBL3_41935 [Kribbella sp. NPDC050124]|uniref:ABC transporter permease subunit n=1 Tax=Kribbella sp. NPDC050124 TaxID=3364114 RepID=UPI0037975743